MKKFALLTAALMLAGAAHATKIVNVVVEPAAPKVGQEVTITVNFKDAESSFCNVRVFYGDGNDHDFKINQEKDVPLVTRHAYAKPGQFRVKAEGKARLPLLKCGGDTKSAIVKVAAAAPAAAGAAAAAAACPSGWKLGAAGVSKKDGNYMCLAKPGTELPSAKLDCKAPLGYFENKAKGQIGCRA